jgi:hypothetical protein
VSLSIDNTPACKLVHRLVADAFLGRLTAAHEVNHIDGCKTNNHIENLELVSRRQNLKHAREKCGRYRGSRNASTVLDEAKVRNIRTMHASGAGYKSLGKRFGVSWEAIRNIIKGRVWVWVTDEPVAA